MRAVVIGGTGATGRKLMAQLLADTRIASVTVLVRRAFFPPNPKLKELIVDFNRLQDYASHIHGDVAFSLLGTTLKQAGSKEAQWMVDYNYQLRFAKIAQENGIFSFILLSAMSSNPKSKLFYSKMKGKLEDQILQLDFPRLIILRPGMIERPNTDRPAEKIMIRILNFFNRIGLLKKYRPVLTDNLARVMLEAVKKPVDKPVQIIEAQKILAQADQYQQSDLK